MATTGERHLPTLVREAVAEDLAKLQSHSSGVTAYNKRWLARLIHEPCGIGFESAQNFLNPGGPFPMKPELVRVRLRAIQTVLDAAFVQEASNGEAVPNDYLKFLEAIPPAGQRRSRFPADPPEGAESSEAEPTRSAPIDDLFHRAASELRPERVNRYLWEIVSQADSLEPEAAQHAVRTRAFAALAVEADTAQERYQRWRKALRSSEREVQAAADLDAVRRRALVAMDATADRFAAFEPSECQRVLARATHDVDAVLDRSSQARDRSALLAIKAALLRHRGAQERFPSPRDDLLDESVRCAEAAVREQVLPTSLLALGQALSQRSGTARTLERQQQMTGEAERHLVLAVERGAGEVGRLALASFYRHQHRPLDAVDAFPLEAPHRNYRRILREAPVFAEAAIELAYNGYPYHVVERALEDARTLLEDAHRGGYGWARHLVDLAVVRGLLDGPSPHDAVLDELFDESGDADWTHIAELAADSGDSLAQEGFSLGVDDASVWNRLGTYALDLLGDDALAERLYRLSMRLDPNPFLPATNLARLLINRGDTADLRDAWKLLADVGGTTPPRFPWWRRERERLHEAVAGLPPEQQFRAPRPKAPKLLANARAARAIDEPVEGQAAVTRVVTALIEQSSLPRTGELAVTYRATEVHFEILWCPPGTDPNIHDAVAHEDEAGERFVVLSHIVDQSTEAAIREARPRAHLVTASELDTVAAGLEHLATLLARKSLEQSSGGSQWLVSEDRGRSM